MEPVTTAAEMRAADEAAQDLVGIEVLIARAGFAVASAAIELLGGAYGRRVVVIAGKGHNGEDGRVAARSLARRGAAVELVEPSSSVVIAPDIDLVIDAAFGTGFRGEFAAPAIPQGVPVLCVDLPSGLDADTGSSAGALLARRTVTFQALKPGLLLGKGPDLAGEVIVADIGLPLGPSATALVVDADLAEIPVRRRTGHKWDAALFVVAGSPGMRGAPVLVASAALRAGAGMVHLATPGSRVGGFGVVEVVERELPARGFASALLDDLGRFGCLVLGPGLGAPPGIGDDLEAVLAHVTVPVVLDADGLNALAARADPLAIARSCSAPLVLTPHEGEFVRLTGAPIGADRLEAVRSLARDADAVVLLKGAPTVIADPSGTTYLVTSGSTRLSTAGTGDVLAGVIGALIARGMPPARAAAIGAHLHGRAALRVAGVLIASDLPAAIGEVLTARGR